MAGFADDFHCGQVLREPPVQVVVGQQRPDVGRRGGQHSDGLHDLDVGQRVVAAGPGNAAELPGRQRRHDHGHRGEGELAPLQAIRDRHGNQVTLTRTAGQSGNITQITSPSGRWIKLSYDTANRVTRAEDNIGRAVSYAYDAGAADAARRSRCLTTRACRDGGAGGVARSRQRPGSMRGVRGQPGAALR